MRRIPALALIVVLLSIGLIGVGLSMPVTLAQEATPEDEEFEVPEGISFEFIAFGELPTQMDPQAELSMYRIHFEPGAGFLATEGDPTTSLVFVEAGVLTLTVDTPIQVLRVAGDGTPFPEHREEIPAGTEFTLNAGDSAMFPANTSGDIRNNGTETVVVLIAELAPEDAFDGEDATPES